IPRKEIVIGGEEPHCSIGVEHPMCPTPRKTNLWFKSPAVRTIINQLCGVVLPGWSHHFETSAEKCFLLPFPETLHVHCGSTFQVHGQTEVGIQTTRTIGLRLRTSHCTPEVAHTVRQ